ncbi:putative reverse transcriptase zinc-binding domain-containing protein [Helianthus annuus]|nr:putative reverse transcriptase zinc-binding domain-containing protein [Helianthus annuus]
MGPEESQHIFACRAEQNRLATLKGLQRRNVHCGSTLGRFCGEAEEDADHLLVSCYVATVVRHKVCTWCKVPWNPISNVRDLLNLYKAGDVSGHKSSLLRLIFIASCWAIWKTRNELIFSGKRASIDRIFGETQAMPFMWMKHRAKEQGLSWANWCSVTLC